MLSVCVFPGNISTRVKQEVSSVSSHGPESCASAQWAAAAAADSLTHSPRSQLPRGHRTPRCRWRALWVDTRTCELSGDRGEDGERLQLLQRHRKKPTIILNVHFLVSPVTCEVTTDTGRLLLVVSAVQTLACRTHGNKINQLQH